VTEPTSIVRCPACGRRNRIPGARLGRVRCAACRADLPWLVSADDTSFDAVVGQSTLPVLVDVWAPWCGPCRMITPTVEQLSRELRGRLKVVKVNADDAPGVSQRYGIRSIPTLLLFREGQERARQVGAPPPAQLTAWVREAVG
jgi:thioredoxin 2